MAAILDSGFKAAIRITIITSLLLVGVSLALTIPVPNFDLSPFFNAVHKGYYIGSVLFPTFDIFVNMFLFTLGFSVSYVWLQLVNLGLSITLKLIE